MRCCAGPLCRLPEANTNHACVDCNRPIHAMCGEGDADNELRRRCGCAAARPVAAMRSPPVPVALSRPPRAAVQIGRDRSMALQLEDQELALAQSAGARQGELRNTDDGSDSDESMSTSLSSVEIIQRLVGQGRGSKRRVSSRAVHHGSDSDSDTSDTSKSESDCESDCDSESGDSTSSSWYDCRMTVPLVQSPNCGIDAQRPGERICAAAGSTQKQQPCQMRTNGCASAASGRDRRTPRSKQRHCR